MDSQAGSPFLATIMWHSNLGIFNILTWCDNLKQRCLKSSPSFEIITATYLHMFPTHVVSGLLWINAALYRRCFATSASHHSHVRFICLLVCCPSLSSISIYSGSKGRAKVLFRSLGVLLYSKIHPG